MVLTESVQPSNVKYRVFFETLRSFVCLSVSSSLNDRYQCVVTRNLCESLKAHFLNSILFILPENIQVFWLELVVETSSRSSISTPRGSNGFSVVSWYLYERMSTDKTYSKSRILSWRTKKCLFGCFFFIDNLYLC